MHIKYQIAFFEMLVSYSTSIRIKAMAAEGNHDHKKTECIHRIIEEGKINIDIDIDSIHL